MRFRTPRSRRNTMLYASAVNVVDITLIPAIAGTSLFRSLWFPCRIAPPPIRNSSGSTKLKNAALGLRQNIFRSRRYWRQLSKSTSLIGGQLQIHVLQTRAPHAQLLQAFALLQGLCREFVQQLCRILGLSLDPLSVRTPIGDRVLLRAGWVAGWVGHQIPWRPDRQHPPV